MLEFVKRPLRAVRKHMRVIRRDVLAEPLNRGRKLELLKNYADWHLRHKYAGRSWIISFENGLQSLVYPFPDHDAGEVNIWSRNVDWYDIRLVRSVLQRGDFVVDAGCKVGNRTLAIADLLSGAMLVDAGARAVERAREILALNSLPSDKFVVLHAAVGDRRGTVTFSDIGGAHTCNRVLAGEDMASIPSVTVPMTTIDDELEKLGKLPTFIKIDVEGYDYLALKGCAKTIASGKVRLVKFEHNRGDPLGLIIALFNEHGWTVFALDDGGRISRAAHLIERNMNLFAAPSAQVEKMATNQLEA